MKIYPKKSKSPLRSIRLFCAECQGSSRTKKKVEQDAILRIKDCPDEMCPLYDFRMGKNPHLKRQSTPKHLKKYQFQRKDMQKSQSRINEKSS
jgi:hypothetical protein